MAFGTQRYYGYRVSNNFSDVIDTDLALERLRLNIGDLNIIRGASDAGAVREDLISLSGLEVPLYKTLDRYLSETSVYKSIMENSGGADASLRGDLEVNGSLVASGIRYRFLKTSPEEIGFADISTSRTSAWSTASSTPVASDPIFYGSQIKINSFSDTAGEGGTVTTNKLTWGEVAQRKLFKSELPTHKITVTINDQEVELYAMKSIPLKVDGYFRNFSGTAEATLIDDPDNPSQKIPINWRIINLLNANVNTTTELTWRYNTEESTIVDNKFVFPTSVNTFTYEDGDIVKVSGTSLGNLNSTFNYYIVQSGQTSGQVSFGLATSSNGSLVSLGSITANILFVRINAVDERRFSGSSIDYRSVVGAPRRIEIYYPPDQFTKLVLPTVGMFQLPKAELPNLNDLNIALNEFRDIPDIATFAPSLKTLDIYRNNLYLAENPSLRKLGLDSINKLPSSITSINMYGTYYGSIRCVNRSAQDETGVVVGPEITTGIGESDSDGPISMSVIEARFPNLLSLNLQRGTGPYFSPDEYDPLCYLPSVPDTCENYFAAYNDFRGIPTSGLKDLTKLKNLNLYGNYYLSDASFSLDSEDIETVGIGYTQLSVPNLSSRTSLRSFDNSYGRRINTLYTGSATDSDYKFSSCSALISLGFYGSYVSGFIPKFKGNNNLSSVDFYAAQYIEGGRPNNGEHGYTEGDTYVMYNDTFSSARNSMRFFRVLSNSLLIGKGFESDTFKNLKNLYYLFWYSYGNTGRGATVYLPDISSCPALQYMIMPVNNFSGPIPSFVSNNVIYYVDLSSNQLTGSIPTFLNKTQIRYVFLNNNVLTSFPGFENTVSMNYAYLHNNQIAGDIPMLRGQAPNLYRLYLYNNLLTRYAVGSFAGLTRIQIIDISNNGLYASDINNIIDDLYNNYIAAPRAGVSINLRSQSNAPGYAPSSLGSVREQEVREKLDFLSSKGWSIATGG
jgi:Leucine-rich repeat (LRR) protein